MPVVICLLRGINVGGHHKVGMAALRELCDSQQLTEARTLLQSGNLLFKTKERNMPALKKRFEACFEQAFGFRSETVFRTAGELRQTLAANPFAKRRDVEPAKLIVAFLAADPLGEGEQQIGRLNVTPEEIHLRGREVFIYYPGGMGQSKLQLPKIERALGTFGTARNWNTVTKLLSMAEEMEHASKPRL